MKILVVIGTRPEAIKMAPIILLLKKKIKKKDLKICITAQHREMLDDVLKLFKIFPDYDLNVMKKNQSLSRLTSNIIIKFEKILDKFKPNLTLVHGDTTTTFAITLANFYKKLPVAHIEAGLRTNNIYSPWPEEANRKITDLLSSMHFVPINNSKKNILKENISSKCLKITGNTVIDALLFTKKNILRNKILRKQMDKQFKFSDKKIILVTAHRRENFGKGILELCKSLKYIVKTRTDVQIIYPVHPNPNIKNIVYKKLSNIKNINLIKPVNYLSMVYLMMKSYLIVTDSGGVQEEAPSLSKPIVILRDVTERPEIIKMGGGVLVKRNQLEIVKTVNKILDNNKIYKKMSSIKNPYGDGKASSRIVKEILNFHF
jgi:UDP-N-acetylglucosamine 2-epimerase (non-hydrolysing)